VVGGDAGAGVGAGDGGVGDGSRFSLVGHRKKRCKCEVVYIKVREFDI
jgi:hypothetical protein